MIILHSFLLLFAFLFMPLASHAWPARVVDVSDGDTILVERHTDGERVKIRLFGIDTPERAQAYGEMARAFVIKNALYQQVEIKPMHTDRYGRLVAVVFLPCGQAMQISLQVALLKAGLAWVWPKYCKDCKDWKIVQREAQQQRIGLWIDADPVEPWAWRCGIRGLRP